MSFINSHTICEIEEYDGIRYIARMSADGSIFHTPVDEIDKKIDADLNDYISACCWPLPTQITPNTDIEDGQHIEHERSGDGADTIPFWIRSISRRIIMFLEENLYLKDDRYSALLVNFIFNSYFPDVFTFAPRIILTGSTACGKSRLQDIIGDLAYHGYATVKPTLAVLIRLIDNYKITAVIDEIQRLKGKDKDALEDIYLSGNKRGKVVSRTNMNTLKVESYEIYAPLMVSKKAGSFLDDDVENRAFVLNMISNSTKKIPPIVDEKRLTQIRTELYSLQTLYKMHPDRFNFKEIFEESIRELTERDEEGNLLCSKTGGCNTELIGRSLDLATTYYTLSKMTGTETEILSLLCENQYNNKEHQKDTKIGHIYAALINCIITKGNENPLNLFNEIITRVSTKEIQEEYNTQQMNGGDQITKWDAISTRRVTDTLADIGFTMGKISGGRSAIANTPDMLEIFMDNLERYGSEEEQKQINNLAKRGVYRPKLTSKLTNSPLLTES